MADVKRTQVDEDGVEWWNPPAILEPQKKSVLPGFGIDAYFPDRDISEWECQIWVRDKMISSVKGGSGSSFRHSVPTSLIPVGTTFYFKVDFYMFPFWSVWAWSGDKVMVDERPIISYPTVGSAVGSDTHVSGTGYPGAVVKLYQANVGDRVFGSGEVGADGRFYITLDEHFPGGSFSLTANQTYGGRTYDWADPVNFTVMSKPIISVPVGGAVVSNRPVVAGRGIQDAVIELYQANSGTVLFGSGRVNSDGYWEVIPDTPFFFGDFSLTVIQKINGATSEWADPVKFHVLDKPVITKPAVGAVVESKPVVEGIAYPDSLVHLYQAGSGTVLFGTARTNPDGTWGVVPHTGFFEGRFSLTAYQKVKGLDSDWAEPVIFTVVV